MDIVEGWVSGATTFTWRSTTPANDGAAVEVFTRRATAAATTPEMLAAGLGATTFMPRRDLSDPEIAALAYCFAHESAVLPDTVRYLHERADGQTT